MLTASSVLTGLEAYDTTLHIKAIQKYNPELGWAGDDYCSWRGVTCDADG